MAGCHTESTAEARQRAAGFGEAESSCCGSGQDKNVGEGERMASLLGGAGLFLWGLSRRSWPGVALMTVGGLFAYRGLSGQCQVYRALGIHGRRREDEREHPVPNGVKVRFGATIDRPAADLYRVWRDLEELPRFMQHLESVRSDGAGRSHWMVRGPLGQTLAWDAEIITDRENEVISWRSLPGAQVASAGSVRFSPAPEGRGTEVRVQFNYEPPAGSAGAAIAWLFGESAQQQVEDDLQRFKAYMESGTIPTAAGQSHGAGAT